jgi:hypothetical protein
MVRIPRYVGWPLLAAWSYGVLWFWAERAAYYPAKFPEGFWDLQSAVEAQDVWPREKLHAWWVAVPEARVATLFLHGNAGNLTHRAYRVPEWRAAGSAVLLLDYRGYGKSEGRPAEKGLYADADAAYDWLATSGWRPQQIVLHGESLGTAVAVDLASRRECAGVVLEAPFTSGSDMAATVLPLVGPLVFRAFDSRSKIERLRAPLLVIHGDRDGVVPFSQGEALFRAAPEPKWFWRVEGAGHNDLVERAGAVYRERLREFYGKLER